MMIHHYNGGHRLVVVIFFKSSGRWTPRSCSCGPWCRSTIVPGWASCSYPPGSRRPQSKICIIIGILLAVSENMYTYIYTCCIYMLCSSLPDDDDDYYYYYCYYSEWRHWCFPAGTRTFTCFLPPFAPKRQKPDGSRRSLGGAVG